MNITALMNRYFDLYTWGASRACQSKMTEETFEAAR
jgi:hypothetical protein